MLETGNWKLETGGKFAPIFDFRFSTPRAAERSQ